jgi:hypothetical protein
MRDRDAFNDTPTRGVENGYLIPGGAGNEKPIAIRGSDERRGREIINGSGRGRTCPPGYEASDAGSQDGEAKMGSWELQIKGGGWVASYGLWVWA